MKRTLLATVLALTSCAVAPVMAEMPKEAPDLICKLNVRIVGEQMPQQYTFRTLIDFGEYKYVSGKDVFVTTPEEGLGNVTMIIDPFTLKGNMLMTSADNSVTTAYGTATCKARGV